MPKPAATEAGRKGIIPAGFAVSPPIYRILFSPSQTSKDFSLGVANQSNIQDAVNKVYQACIVNGDDIQKSLDQGEADVNKLLKQ